MTSVNLAQKLSLFNEHWSPKVVGELNGQLVKLVKFTGEFVWHSHEHEDEMFLVVKGRFRMEYREDGAGKSLDVSEGEFVNRAQVLSGAAGIAMSSEATATVRVIPDVTFDCTDPSTLEVGYAADAPGQGTIVEYVPVGEKIPVRSSHCRCAR